MSKYSHIFKEARKDVNQNTIKPEETLEAMVNLCVKVPLTLRRHWAGESKKRGISMTDVIIEALNNEFGEPPLRAHQPETQKVSSPKTKVR